MSARPSTRPRRTGYHRVERAFGSFSRSLTLPEGVDAEAVEASFDRGVLEVRIPKPEQRKPRKISIASATTPRRSSPSRPPLSRTPAGAANVAAPVFSIRTRDPGSYARTGTLKLAHGEVRTPAFVPLATKAVVKTLEVREAAALGFDMVLGNTFHLFLTPGHELIEQLGGLHELPALGPADHHRLRRLPGLLDGPRHRRRRDQGPRRAVRAASAPARSSRSRRRA